MEKAEHGLKHEEKGYSLISGDDWYVINDIIREIYASKDSRQARHAVLNRIGELIPFDKGSFMLGSICDGYIDYFDPILVNETEEHLTPYMEKYQHFDPMNVFYLQSEAVSYIDSEYVTDKMVETSELYREWFHPNGMYYMLGSKLSYNGVFLGSTLLSRRKEDRNFNQRDKEIMAIITEHLSLHIHTFYPNGVTKDTVATGGSPISVRYGLSTREMEVLDYLKTGCTAKEIAEKLCISEHTVKRHVGNIYRKMGVSGKAKLLALLRQEY